MSATPVRPTAIFLVVVSSLTLSLLTGCGSGTGTHACNEAGCCTPSDACPAPQYVYGAGIGGQISTFPVTPGTGALSSPTSVSGPQDSLGLAVLNNQFLYASNPVALSGSSVNAWSITLGDGSLTTVPGSPFSLGIFSLAGGLAVNNTAQVVYVADAGKIDALQADSIGALTAITGSPFTAGTGLFLTVDPQNRFLFASDTTPPGNIYAFTIDSQGALTPVPGSPFAVVPNSSSTTQPDQLVVDSTGSFLYVGLQTTNQVAAFSIAPATGVLTPVPGSPFPAGAGPLALITASNFLYVSNAMDGTLSGYSINSTTGILTPLSGSPFAISAGSLTSNPGGGFLYTSGSQGVLSFSIDTSTGALTPVGSPIAYPGATVLTYVQ